MKIACIVGARPQFIKLAPLSRQLRKRHKEIIIHTGQHYDPELSEVFFRELKIPEPDYNLEVGSAEQGKQTGEMLVKLEEVLQFEKPDWVIIFGDTNTTLAGALAASKLHLPLAHIEAGMRSYNNCMPEEINRRIADHLSGLLFCPTPKGVANLRKEGINRGVYLVGDLMYEALAENIERARRKSRILNKLKLQKKEYFLVTIHRAENTDSQERLAELVLLLSKLDWKTIFLVHPRTKKYLQEYGWWSKLAQNRRLRLIEPVGYLDMLILEENAQAVLTDSGGVQREAFFLGSPCLVLRNQTEWTEILGKQKNVLLGSKLSITGIKWQPTHRIGVATSRHLRVKPVARTIVNILSRSSSKKS